METERSAYETPVLVKIGSLEEITLATNGGIHADQVIPVGGVIHGHTS